MLHYKYSESQILKFPTVDDKLYIHLEVGDVFLLHAYLEIHLFRRHALNLRELIPPYRSSGGQEKYIKLL